MAILSVAEWGRLMTDVGHFVARYGLQTVYEAVKSIEASDPWHDEGNATNHRLSQCTERCK